uniref:Uncharacterized protein n=1 Tax=Candidatus Kentrum sp. MB TaxID=2138164 RepID=A0A450XS33_9GAMM|nr:MAG: hypothetical protein BECKMB1821G_GA0114241_102840 [Candidatus Kentron sp. MB]VFK32089.1 MAG: hypothetical protein BECKMB1821I_GA0114274_102939 [Candidatus Kentron sp. MB]VFK75646.1 MAG: hypothetical protein BECKMB1821H_GA0114242_10289 [Candidatus Kentron sp. MB]
MEKDVTEKGVTGEPETDDGRAVRFLSGFFVWEGGVFRMVFGCGQRFCQGNRY